MGLERIKKIINAKCEIGFCQDSTSKDLPIPKTGSGESIYIDDSKKTLAEGRGKSNPLFSPYLNKPVKAGCGNDEIHFLFNLLAIVSATLFGLLINRFSLRTEKNAPIDLAKHNIDLKNFLSGNNKLPDLTNAKKAFVDPEARLKYLWQESIVTIEDLKFIIEERGFVRNDLVENWLVEEVFSLVRAFEDEYEEFRRALNYGWNMLRPDTRRDFVNSDRERGYFVVTDSYGYDEYFFRFPRAYLMTDWSTDATRSIRKRVDYYLELVKNVAESAGKEESDSVRDIRVSYQRIRSAMELERKR